MLRKKFLTLNQLIIFNKPTVMSRHGKNMKLYTSAWVTKPEKPEDKPTPYKTLKLMPVTNDCPYLEVICERDYTGTVLVVITKEKKEHFKMVEKLDENGSMMPPTKPRMDGGQLAQERVKLQMYSEYYIVEPSEQEEFLKEFAINADKFDYNQYLEPLKEPTIIQNQEGGQLVDTNGKALKTV